MIKLLKKAIFDFIFGPKITPPLDQNPNEIIVLGKIVNLGIKGREVRCHFYDFLQIDAEFYALSDEVIRIPPFWLLFPTKAIF